MVCELQIIAGEILQYATLDKSDIKWTQKRQKSKKKTKRRHKKRQKSQKRLNEDKKRQKS